MLPWHKSISAHITEYRINNTCKNSTSYTHTTEWLQHKKPATLVQWLHVTYTYFTNYYNLSRCPTQHRQPQPQRDCTGVIH